MAFDITHYRNTLVVTDGDWRSELFLRGWKGTSDLERANLSKPDIVRDVAEAFLDAGAKVLVTSTAGANVLSLAERLDAKDMTENEILAMNREGAAICRAAASEYPAKDLLVFGAMGPTEQLLMLNEIEDATLHDAYETQAGALAAGGVDAILCRSFTEIQALSIAVKAATSATGLPVVGSMTFDCGPEQTETTLGVTIPQACAEMVDAGASVVGCDCGENPDAAQAVVTLMRQSCGLPIWVKINAGVPQLVEGRVAYPETPDEFTRRLAPLAQAGANFVGGCHGASVDHIAAMAASRKEPKSKRGSSGTRRRPG